MSPRPSLRRPSLYGGFPSSILNRAGAVSSGSRSDPNEEIVQAAFGSPVAPSQASTLDALRGNPGRGAAITEVAGATARRSGLVHVAPIPSGRWGRCPAPPRRRDRQRVWVPAFSPRSPHAAPALRTSPRPRPAPRLAFQRLHRPWRGRHRGVAGRVCSGARRLAPDSSLQAVGLRPRTSRVDRPAGSQHVTRLCSADGGCGNDILEEASKRLRGRT